MGKFNWPLAIASFAVAFWVWPRVVAAARHGNGNADVNALPPALAPHSIENRMVTRAVTAMGQTGNHLRGFACNPNFTGPGFRCARDDAFADYDIGT